MRRKTGELIPLEQAIWASAARLPAAASLHGYELARPLTVDEDRRLLTACSTLHRALGRLEAMGLLESRREDPQIAARENRPGRRLNALTPAGQTAARAAASAVRGTVLRRTRRRVAPV